MDYTDFCTPEEVATTKKVRSIQSKLATTARKQAALIVHGTIGDGTRSRKQFVNTHLGKYRLRMDGTYSDNSTEHAAHVRMGVTPVNMNNDKDMRAWFRAHGLNGAAAIYYWKQCVARALAVGELR